jgi:hypothetical protein
MARVACQLEPPGRMEAPLRGELVASADGIAQGETVPLCRPI